MEASLPSDYRLLTALKQNLRVHRCKDDGEDEKPVTQ
jgi:hypothetical protein